MDAKDRYNSLFQYYGALHGIDWKLLKAQAMAESGLDPNAVSPVGAKGLAQFMPATFAEWFDKVWGVKGIPHGDPSNPETSISLQAAYLKALLGAFDHKSDVAFAAYNWGWGRVAKHLKQYGGLNVSFLPQETRDYILRIDRIYARLRG